MKKNKQQMISKVSEIMCFYTFVIEIPENNLTISTIIKINPHFLFFLKGL